MIHDQYIIYLTSIIEFAPQETPSSQFKIGIGCNKSRTRAMMMNIYICMYTSDTYDFPPNSKVTGVKVLAAAVMIILPTVPLPV